MKIYESTFIVDVRVADPEVDKLIERISQVVKTTGGEVLKIDKLGKRELAYMIEKQKEGFYVYMELKLNPEALLEIERIYKISESVLRFLTVNKIDAKPPKVRKKKETAAPSTSARPAAAPASTPAPAAAPKAAEPAAEQKTV